MVRGQYVLPVIALLLVWGGVGGSTQVSGMQRGHTVDLYFGHTEQ